GLQVAFGRLAPCFHVALFQSSIRRALDGGKAAMAPEKSTDDLEDKPPTGGYAKTSMIVRIELPALSKAVQVHFALEPSKSKRVLDGLSDFVRDIPRKWNDELLDFDPDSSEKQLDSFRQGALADLDSWNTKVKAAEEWKRKVDNAAANMNKMRDAYYRETV
ncbi:unnamed protein product, partial [Prorocentrum cordatum]